ncbi:MAG: tRNA lysidine(34) synthetase TilS [Desulfomonilaceae bacterium]
MRTERHGSEEPPLHSARRAITLHGMFKAGDGVVAGVSGGPDSTALLHILNMLRTDIGFWIMPAHLDHGLRPESPGDAEFVREMSLKLGMEAQIRRINVGAIASRRGISVEEAGRHARYAFFEEVRASCGAKVIATAHHLDDVCETFFLRIFRGSSLKGLTGILPARGRVVRPLIETSRAAILRFLEEARIPYRIDSTNREICSDRNFVRNRLIPTITEHFPNFGRPLQRTIDLLKEEDGFLNDLARELYSRSVIAEDTGLIMSVPSLSSAHKVLVSRVILLALYEISGPDVRWSRSHVDAVWKLLLSPAPSAQAHLACGLIAAREYDKLVLFRNEASVSPPPPPILVTEPGIVQVPESGLTLRLQVVEREAARSNEFDGITAVAFDADEVPFPLTVRHPKQGDRFKPWGLQGTQKLKKVLIDLKIPRRLRARLPLLLKNDTILWIPGARRGDAAPIVSQTRRILVARIEKGADQATCGPSNK